MSIEQSWDRIARWFDDNTPPGYFGANPGASPESIDALERAIASPLPGDFRDSLSQHDGGTNLWLLPTHGELLPVSRIVSMWEGYTEWQQSGEYANPQTWTWPPIPAGGPIKPFFWSPKRLFVSDNSGDHVTLDLEPGDVGRYGQVLYHSHEVGPREVLASSWSTYLELVVDELESGKYTYDEHEECVVDPEAS